MKFLVTAFVILLGTSGCNVAGTETSEIGAEARAIESSNRVLVNRVLVNKLSAYQLSSSHLGGNVLADASYAFNTAGGGGIETTADGREVLDYMIRCALNPGTVITVTHDSDVYHYEGQAGLSPNWLSSGLTENEKERISACLFAHINYFGVSVDFSFRMDEFVDADAAEQARYKVHEGGFYGAYFVSETMSIQWFSCQGDSQDVAWLNSSDRPDRVCTDSSSGCALIVTGACREVCDTYTAPYGWSDCWGGGVQYAAVANAFLDADDPDFANQTCGTGQTCTGASAMLSGEDHAAILDSNGALVAVAECESDSTCIMNGIGATSFTATVDDAIADVNCRDAGTCIVQAKPGADVEIDCGGATTCTNITCEDGASCLLYCGNATSCGFSGSTTGAIHCGNGNWVHERTCP